MIDAATSTPIPAGKERAAGQGRSIQPAKPAQGLIVELANVVYDTTAWIRQLCRLVSRLREPTSLSDFQAVWHREYLADVHRGRREHAEALEAFLHAQRLSWGEIDEVVAASRGHELLSSESRPLGGVVKTLNTLGNQGTAIVVWAECHWPATRLLQRFEADGLAPCVRCVSSFDLEEVQPSVACLHACLAQLELEPTSATYLGHEAASLAAASRLGLTTAAFNFTTDVRADVYLGRFDELLRMASPGRQA